MLEITSGLQTKRSPFYLKSLDKENFTLDQEGMLWKNEHTETGSTFGFYSESGDNYGLFPLAGIRRLHSLNLIG